MAHYRFSHRAEADLMEIEAYTLEKWGQDQAVRYIYDLEKTCGHLDNNPQLGRICESIRPNLRRMESGSHVIFYRTDDAGILISRILHQSMLPERQHLD